MLPYIIYHRLCVYIYMHAFTIASRMDGIELQSLIWDHSPQGEIRYLGLISFQCTINGWLFAPGSVDIPIWDGRMLVK